MSQMGRKPKPEAERLTQQIKIRFTTEQMDRFWIEAHRQRRPLAEVLREMLLAGVQNEEST